MLKFFNKIRRQMLIENKMGRYLKYAIGEIILVMIGILLALQVNTWNNNREVKKEEAKVLKSLHREFQENLLRFDEIYKKQLHRKRSIESIMAANIKELSPDSLVTLITGVDKQWTFDPFQGIYNSVINSGKIELITSDSLKFKIARFQDLLKDYSEEESGTQEFTANNYYPHLADKLKMNFEVLHDLNGRSEEFVIQQELIELIDSDKFENLLVFIYGYMTDIFIEGPILREEMLSIIDLLESEIEKHN